MRRFILVVSHLLFASMLVPVVSAEEASPDTTAPDTAKVDAKKAVADSSGKKEKKKKKKTFEEVTKDFEVVRGLFTVYRKDDEGKVYLEIKPRQFDRLYLCAVTREAADGYFFDATALIPSFMNYGFPFYPQTHRKKRAVPAQKRLLPGGRGRPDRRCGPSKRHQFHPERRENRGERAPSGKEEHPRGRWRFFSSRTSPWLRPRSKTAR